MYRTNIYLIVACALAGCSAPGPRPDPVVSPGTAIIAHGDWDDVDASVEAAVGRNEMAIVRRISLELEPAEAVDIPTRRRAFDLVTSDDQPARIKFVAKTTTDPGDIEVFARVGRFGDRAREESLLRAVRERLEDLAGRDFAPMRRR